MQRKHISFELVLIALLFIYYTIMNAFGRREEIDREESPAIMCGAAAGVCSQ
jgi:hypothetical protein